jgi:hypothetical protein
MSRRSDRPGVLEADEDFEVKPVAGVARDRKLLLDPEKGPAD